MAPHNLLRKADDLDSQDLRTPNSRMTEASEDRMRVGQALQQIMMSQARI
jgi:hypothetical protein